MNRGAIILCGGQSSRMGRDKALLPFGPGETLLQRVVRIVGRAVPLDRVICAASARQPLPELPVGVRVVQDEMPNCGPLAGLAAGLTALDGDVDAAFVCGCDAPLLEAAFIQRMFELLGDHQAAVCGDGDQLHPLPGIYQANILPIVRSLLIRDRRSLQSLLGEIDAFHADVGQLQAVDPELRSLWHCNTPAEYRQALSCAFPGAGAH